MAVAEQSSVLQDVVPGFSKEAKARASPSPSFGGFGFIVFLLKKYTPAVGSQDIRNVKSLQLCANDSPGGAECPLFSRKQAFPTAESA